MEKEKTDNELIAEFMGLKWFDQHGARESKVYNGVQLPDEEGGEIVEAEYHTSWDWLMPVWIKFKDLPYWAIDDGFVRRKEECEKHILNGEIHNLHICLSEALKWYNSSIRDFKKIAICSFTPPEEEKKEIIPFLKEENATIA